MGVDRQDRLVLTYLPSLIYAHASRFIEVNSNTAYSAKESTINFDN